MIEPTLGKPSKPGIYAARQWYGWRILEWHGNAWWHVGRQTQWPKKAEIDAFVGPLPVIARDFSVKEAPVEDWEKELHYRKLQTGEYDL